MKLIGLGVALAALSAPLSAQDVADLAPPVVLIAPAPVDDPKPSDPAPVVVDRTIKPSVADNGTYDVRLSPRMIVPPKEPHTRGERRKLLPGDTAFKAQLGWLFHGRTTKDVSAQISGIDLTIAKGEILRQALAWGGGDLDRFPSDSTVYCQRAKGNLVKDTLSALTLGLSDLASRVSKESQFCLMDTDLDGMFDHAFLEGLKKPEDRHAIAIEPVNYGHFSADDDAGVDEGDYIQVVMAKTAGLFGRSMVTEVYLGTALQTMNGFYTYQPFSTDRYYSGAVQKIPGKNYPQAMIFGNAALRVHGYDKTTKEMEVEYIKDFDFTPLTMSVTVYY